MPSDPNCAACVEKRMHTAEEWKFHPEAGTGQINDPPSKSKLLAPTQTAVADPPLALRTAVLLDGIRPEWDANPESPVIEIPNADDAKPTNQPATNPSTDPAWGPPRT